jgi:hypothetical protein
MRTKYGEYYTIREAIISGRWSFVEIYASLSNVNSTLASQLLYTVLLEDYADR